MGDESGDLHLRFLSGDPDAIGVVGRWVSVVLTSWRFLRLRHEWPDLQQEVLTRVLGSLRRDRFDATRDFRAYVQGIARFTAMEARDRLRARERHEGEDAAGAGAAGGTEGETARGVLARTILGRATPECRDLLTDFYTRRLTYQEIARERGLPIGTVKSRLFRCLECAQRELGLGRGRRSPRSAEPPHAKVQDS